MDKVTLAMTPLVGERVTLRPFAPDDAPAIVDACRSPDIARYTMMPDHVTLDSARKWIDNSIHRWPHGLARFAITVPPSNACVGQVGALVDLARRRAEVFYWLHSASRGAGLTSEALGVVVAQVLRDERIRRVQLITHLDNDASQRVAKRCGFTREGVLRSWEPIKDAQPDVVMWSRLPGDDPPSRRRTP